MTTRDMGRYFFDIDGHIEALQIDLDISESDSDHADALIDRIKYLKNRRNAGYLWVDNDTMTAIDAWKNLEIYTQEEAEQKFDEWDE